MYAFFLPYYVWLLEYITFEFYSERCWGIGVKLSDNLMMTTHLRSPILWRSTTVTTASWRGQSEAGSTCATMSTASFFSIVEVDDRTGGHNASCKCLFLKALGGINR